MKPTVMPSLATTAGSKESKLATARKAQIPGDVNLLTRVPVGFGTDDIALLGQEYTEKGSTAQHRHRCVTVVVSGVPQSLIGGETVLPVNGQSTTIDESGYFNYPVLKVKKSAEFYTGFKTDVNSGVDGVDIEGGQSVVADRVAGGHKQLGARLAGHAGDGTKHLQTLQGVRDEIIAHSKSPEGQDEIRTRGALRHGEGHVRLTPDDIEGVGITLTQSPIGITDAITLHKKLEQQLNKTLPIFVYGEKEGAIWDLSPDLLARLEAIATSSLHAEPSCLESKLKKELTQIIQNVDFEIAENYSCDPTGAPSPSEMKVFYKNVFAAKPDLAIIVDEIRETNRDGMNLTCQFEMRLRDGTWAKMPICRTETGDTFPLAPPGTTVFRLTIAAEKRGLIKITKTKEDECKVYEIAPEKPIHIPVSAREISKAEEESAKAVDQSLIEMLYDLSTELAIEQYIAKTEVQEEEAVVYRCISSTRSTVAQSVSFLPPMPEGDRSIAFLAQQLNEKNVCSAGRTSIVWKHMFINDTSNLQQTFSELCCITLKTMLEQQPERECCDAPIAQKWMNAKLPARTEITFVWKGFETTGRVKFKHGYNDKDFGNNAQNKALLNNKPLLAQWAKANRRDLDTIIKELSKPNFCVCDVCGENASDVDIKDSGMLKTKEKAKHGEIDVCPECLGSLLAKGYVSDVDGISLAHLTIRELQRIQNIQRIFEDLKTEALKSNSDSAADQHARLFRGKPSIEAAAEASGSSDATKDGRVKPYRIL